MDISHDEKYSVIFQCGAFSFSSAQIARFSQRLRRAFFLGVFIKT